MQTESSRETGMEPPSPGTADGAATDLSVVPPPPEEEAISILIVDDEPRNLTALETVLDDPAYRLVRANSANEALLALVAEDFALLVLDVQMPDMNGFELALMIKQRKRSASIPIIFLTAYSSEDQHLQQGYSTGAVDFLHKPISPVILRSKVAVFAELHRKTMESVRANRALLTEVAERRRAQEELRELNEQLERRVGERTSELSVSEARFRALAEEMPHLVWEMDAHGKTTYQNSRSEAYSAPGEHWIDSVHPEDAALTAATWAASLRTGRECDIYCRQRRIEDGVYRWFHVKAAPARDGLGDVIRWVGTSTDIHEQRTAEEALRLADKRKDEFLAMLGHELRNPLAAIRHAVRISAEAGEENAGQWANEVIDRQSTQLTRMVDDLLDVERINRGRIELKFAPVSLEAVISTAVTAARPIIKDRKHTLTVDPVDPSLHVRGDRDRLEQVFVNLLTNAAKYTPEGGRIHIAARTEGEEAVISVTDNGVGIAPELLPYVFDLFTQATTSLDRAQGGLGIGLTVVKSLVDMHGGSVNARSGQDPQGAVFTVVLPLMAAEKAARIPAPVPGEASPLPRRVRVLIVDDHVDAAQTLARLLTRRNCEVKMAHDGPRGVETAREFRPEVLLLDLGLPGFDGYEVARVLRSDPSCQGALFIAISGYAQESDRRRSAEAGFEFHCAKPVEFATLMTAIRGRILPDGV